MLAPLVVFVFNRPNHTKKMLENLIKVNLAKETDLIIFSDGPRNSKDFPKIEKTRKIIDKFQLEKYFKSCKVINSENNRGLANSVVNGVSQVIGNYGKVIVLEDDLIVHPLFLEFMNRSLNYYSNDDQIWSISGFNIPISIPKDYSKNIYLSYRASSWGWATWENRWKTIDWEIKEYDKFKSNLKMRYKFNNGGWDLSSMLDAQMTGKIDSWAIRWCFNQFRQNKFTVYPIKSFVTNIGLDGSGTHSEITRVYNNQYNIDKTDLILEDLQINCKIVGEFRDHYGSRYGYFLSEIKKSVRRLFKRSNK